MYIFIIVCINAWVARKLRCRFVASRVKSARVCLMKREGMVRGMNDVLGGLIKDEKNEVECVRTYGTSWSVFH